MPKFRITPRARDDLKNIGRYTERQWGKSQRNIYLQDFEKRFHWLAENPRVGKHRSDVTVRLLQLPAGPARHLLPDCPGKH
jgi:toxin ParE1/3/4